MNTPEIALISPSDLLIDPELQARGRIDLEHVERLARTDHKTWPPLAVTPVPDQPGKYAILDGAHRFLAGQQVQLFDGRVGHLKQYRCVVFPNGGYVESFALNADHPLSLSLNDRKGFAHFLKENYPALSNREIAKRAGMARRTVDGLFKRDIKSSPKQPNYIKRFMGLLVEAYESGEASGFLGLGEHRSEAIVAVIHESANPQVAVKALTLWTDAARAAIKAIGSAGKDKLK